MCLVLVLGYELQVGVYVATGFRANLRASLRTYVLKATQGRLVSEPTHRMQSSHNVATTMISGAPWWSRQPTVDPFDIQRLWSLDDSGYDACGDSTVKDGSRLPLRVQSFSLLSR